MLSSLRSPARACGLLVVALALVVGAPAGAQAAKRPSPASCAKLKKASARAACTRKACAHLRGRKLTACRRKAQPAKPVTPAAPVAPPAPSSPTPPSAPSSTPAPAPADCSVATPVSPEGGFTDVPYDPRDPAYVQPTKDDLLGAWTEYQPYSGALTMNADCTYASPNGGSGGWRIHPDGFVTFDGTLAGFCAGHARLDKRYGTQRELSFYCDGPSGRTYVVFVHD